MAKRVHTYALRSVQTAKKARKSKTRPLTIDDMPNEILALFFKHFKTHEQWALRRVCYRWKGSIERILRPMRSLELNLLWNIADPKHDYNKWTPANSIQSIQYDCNRTEPKALELCRKVQVTVQQRHFNAHCANALGRIFSHAKKVVIYFDHDEAQHILDSFLSMIGHFKACESFSLIRSEMMTNEQFMPQLYATLEQLAPFTRLELYVESVYAKLGYPPLREMSLNKSLKLAEHFALSCWPFMISRNDQSTVLRNVGESFSTSRQKTPNRPANLTSLAIPIYSPFLREINLDLAKVFSGNPELQSVKQLQLTGVRDRFETVGKALELCPNLQSLQMFNCTNVDTSTIINLINKCEHLIDFKLFGDCLSPYKVGDNALRIRSLTLGSSEWFDTFKHCHERGVTDVVSAFVRLITGKFPNLEELTVLSHEKTSILNWCDIKREMKTQLRAQYKPRVLKVKIEMFHLVFQAE